MKKYLLLFSLSLLIAALMQETNTDSQPTPADTKRPIKPLSTEDSLFLSAFETQLFKSLKEEGVPGGALAIIMDSAIVLKKTYGLRDVESGKEIDENTIFRLASLSKALTGLMAAKLVETGQLDWSTPLSKYLPELELIRPALTDSIQLVHLLSHTSGFPRHTYSNLLNMGVAYEEILDMLSDTPLSHPPGTYYNYQNVIFSLAGDMCEAAAQQTFDSLMHQYLFQPLQMQGASTGFSALMDEGNIAMPHLRTESGPRKKEVEPNFYEVGPAAGINASINDMVQLLEALLGLTNWSVPDTVFTPRIGIPLPDRSVRNWRPLEAAHYGLGWRILDMEEMRIYQHSGYVDGYRSEIAFSKSQQVGIVILTNSQNYTVGSLIPAFFRKFIAHKQLTSKGGET
jgi:beta-lactamase class C